MIVKIGEAARWRWSGHIQYGRAYSRLISREDEVEISFRIRLRELESRHVSAVKSVMHHSGGLVLGFVAGPTLGVWLTTTNQDWPMTLLTTNDQRIQGFWFETLPGSENLQIATELPSGKRLAYTVPIQATLGNDDSGDNENFSWRAI